MLTIARFCAEKSELGVAERWYQRTALEDLLGVAWEILVSFLSLALWRTLEMWMRGKGLGTCARQLVGEIATIKSMDIILPLRTGDEVTELRLRTVGRPDRMVADLLHHLRMNLPERSRTND